MEYILLLVWIGFIALVAKGIKLKKTITVNGVQVERYYWLFAFIAFLPIILLAGNRPNWYSDTYNYMNSYKAAPESFSGIIEYVSTITKDKGYYFFSALFKIVTHADYRVYFIVLAFIQGLSVVSLYRKYSEEYVLSLFLFVASSDFFWMFNGIRQFTAVTIIIAATALMLNKRYMLFIIVVLFASFLHQTALLMIPVFLITIGPAWNKRTIIFIALTLVALLFIGRFTSLLDDALQNTQYSSAADLISGDMDDGTHPLRVAVYSVPAIIAFIGRQKIKQSNDVLINLCTNLSIITAGLYFISMLTSGITLGRLPIYTSIYSYILLPWELNNIVQKRYKTIIILITVIAYLLLYYYQMHIAWSRI